MAPEVPPYEIEGRERIAEVPGLRVQVLTLAEGQCVPWHRHTAISDTFFCLEGPMLVELRDPTESVLLACGERTVVPPGRPHRVAGASAGRCRFVIVQGVGEYDYLPE
jgi:quercetin dioxygenase-like cupin family protein